MRHVLDGLSILGCRHIDVSPRTKSFKNIHIPSHLLFHFLIRCEHKVRLALLDEPTAILLHVCVAIAHAALLFPAAADECHVAVADARSRVAADVHRLLSVQVIHHLEQGEEARESIAYLLLALRSEDLVASLRDDLGIVGDLHKIVPMLTERLKKEVEK